MIILIIINYLSFNINNNKYLIKWNNFNNLNKILFILFFGKPFSLNGNLNHLILYCSMKFVNDC